MDIGVPDRFILKKRLEMKREELLFEKKKLETELLIKDRELEKVEKEIENFKDIE